MTDPKSANPQGGKNIQGQQTGKQGGLNTQQGARPNAAGQQGGFKQGNTTTTGTGTGTGTGGKSGTGSKTGGR
jgi:hypothetical protein